MFRFSGSAVWILLLALASLASAGCRSSAGGAQGGSFGSPGDLAGTWSGVILSYPQRLHVEIDLQLEETSPGQAVDLLTGKVRIQSLDSYFSGRSFDVANELSSGDAFIQLDLNSSTFQLGIRSDGTRQSQNWTTLLMGRQGLFDSRGDQIALLGGRLQNGLDGAVFLVRPKKFKSIAKSYKTFNRPPGGTRLGRLARLFGGGPSKKKLKSWVSPILEDPSAPALYQGRSGSIEQTAIALFEDKHFKAHFGKTFDQLGKSTLDAVHRKLRDMGGQKATEQEQTLAVLNRMFWTNLGSPSGTQTLQGVYTLRAVQGWASTQQTRLEQLRGAEADWEVARRIQSVAQTSSAPWLLPNQSVEFEAAAESALARVAHPVLNARLDAIAQIPEDRTRRIEASGFLGQAPEMRQRLSSAQRSALDDRANRLIEEAAGREILLRTSQLADLGSGLAAIEAGNAWAGRFQTEFSQVRNLPAYQDALASYRQRRAADLDAARPAMLAAVERANASELSRLGSDWFADTGDRGHATYREFQSAVDQRRNHLASTYEQRVDEAEQAARDEVGPGDRRPLRYIDFRKLPSGEFLEFIYYGTGSNPDQAQVLGALANQDFGAMFDTVQFVAKMKLAFAGYHDLYFDRYGSTPAERARSGESWTGIVERTVVTNNYGVISDTTDSEPFTWVRSPYAKAYKSTMASEVDAFALILGAAIEAAESGGNTNQQRAAFAENLFGSIFNTPLGQRTAFESFLDEFKEDYPATVVHFEENLRRALQLEPLVRITPIPLSR